MAEAEATSLRTARPLRSVLFFPGHQERLFAKALASEADAVCIDLEDAVPLKSKEKARATTLRMLEERSTGGPAVLVRVNPAATDVGTADLRALGSTPMPPSAILIPKVGGPDDLRQVEDALGPEPGVPLAPLIETAEGLHRVFDIAGGSPRVAFLVFGGIDLSTELGSSTEWDSLLYARSRIVHAAALQTIPAVDMPFPDFRDLDSLEREAERSRALGFVGKIALHPDQVLPIHRAFTPSAEEIDRARRIVEEWDRHGGGAVSVGGGMVDAPVVAAARRTLALVPRPNDA